MTEELNVERDACEAGSGGGQYPGPEYILLGLGTGDVQVLVKDTLEKASKSLEITAYVNIAVLLFGAFIVSFSFVLASITGGWEVVTFGGFGIAAIIASLITNPLKAIGMGARQLVQVQVTYLGFLAQLSLLRSSLEIIGETALLARSKQLSEVVKSSLEVLQKYFG